MSDEPGGKSAGLLKFSKLNCLRNPKEAANPKVYDSYSYLDLHLNQFLSNITDEYTFLPNSIYKPAVHVYINGRLVYKTKILDFNNDLFDETIRLKIYSPSTLVTLKLFENEQFNTTKSDELNLKKAPTAESTSLFMVSWVDLEIGLLVPERDYKAVCTFKSNPSFNPYNPGGLLYYPTKGNKPSILSRRVCSSCKVCSLLSHLSVGGDKNFESIFKYFDHKFVDPGSDSCEKREEAKRAEPEDKTEDEDVNLVEVIDMTNLSRRGKRDGCNCLPLRSIPPNFKRNKFEVCLKCHDYEVCCEHSLSNYYLSVNFKLVPSAEKIDFATEFFSCLLAPPRSVPVYGDLASIFDRFYQNYYSFESVFRHLQCSRRLALTVSKFVLVFLLLGAVFNRFLTALLFLLSVFSFFVRMTSTSQFRRDNGDILYAARNMRFIDQGFEKFIMKHVERPPEYPLTINGKVYTVDPKSIERNNFNIPQHEVEDKTRVYTKAHASYRRCEHIALKTICYAISESIPAVVKATLLRLLGLSDWLVNIANAALAVARCYGLHLSVAFFLLGLLSLKFHRLYGFLLRTAMLALAVASLGRQLEPVRRTCSLLHGLALYLVLRVYRHEWFLNC